ncbi:MAG: hypothetical protein EZS28_018440, partial [Streblomastix strix]
MSHMKPHQIENQAIVPTRGSTPLLLFYWLGSIDWKLTDIGKAIRKGIYVEDCRPVNFRVQNSLELEDLTKETWDNSDINQQKKIVEIEQQQNDKTQKVTQQKEKEDHAPAINNDEQSKTDNSDQAFEGQIGPHLPSVITLDELESNPNHRNLLPRPPSLEGEDDNYEGQQEEKDSSTRQIANAKSQSVEDLENGPKHVDGPVITGTTQEQQMIRNTDGIPDNNEKKDDSDQTKEHSK